MIEDIYPLSPLQEGMYYHWLKLPQSPLYFEQMSYTLQGALSIPVLEKSYQLLIARHAALRTCFSSQVADVPLQIVKKQVPLVFLYKDVSEDTGFSVDDFKAIDRAKGFDLHSGSQMRLTVLCLKKNVHEFIWSFHHIIMDGWCGGILIKEFFQIYDSLLQGRTPQLNKIQPYSDYIKWLGSINKERSLEYWNNYLQGFKAPGSLPKIASAENDYIRQKITFSLVGSLRQSIKDVCFDNGITENTFIQTVWGILLSRYNNSNDVVFGAVVSGRPGELKGIEEMIGLFINTIPVRIKINDGVKIISLLKEVQQSFIEGTAHHYVQLAEVQSNSEPGRDLFDHILVFENYPVQDIVLHKENNTRPEDLTVLSSGIFEQSNYDFSVMIIPGNLIKVRFDYNARLYSDDQMLRLKGHFIRIIEQIAANPARNVEELDYLTEHETQQLLYEFNDTEKDYPKYKAVIELFEEQVQKTPDHIALIFEGKALTYRTLNEVSNQLGHYLRKEYVAQSDDIIGIKLERSEWLIIAVFAVLKSGAAYLPIDPAYPEERLQYMLQDSKCKLLIDDTEIDHFKNRQEIYDNTNLPHKAAPNDLAYIIYTSGTTGNPKGVMIEQHSLNARLHYFKNTYNLTSDDAVLFYRSYSFDGSIEEYLLPFMTGAKCVIAPKDFKHDIINKIISYTADNKITKINMPPVLLQELVQEADDEALRKLSSLKHVVSGGDKLTLKIVNDYLSLFSAKLYNTYGPTENTIDSTNWCAGKNSCERVAIGKPVENSSAYILDDHLKMVPIGVCGELYVGGAGLARGYLHNAELTAEKFIANPFCNGERMYKTGDICRWLPDGNIEFIGRKDDQVKIRGYRIEPAEIERVLQTYKAISSCVVTAEIIDGNDKELIAYFIAEEVINISDVRNYLNSWLPSYMVPGFFVQVEEWPLNNNGKIDKNKLSAFQSSILFAQHEYMAPRNQTEEKLTLVWQELLGKQRVGITDNFFEVGGNSIKIVRLSKRISSVLGQEISVALLFQYPTIKDLSDHLFAQPVLYDQNEYDQTELISDLNKFNVN